MNGMKRDSGNSVFVRFVICIGFCFSVGTAQVGFSDTNSPPPQAQQLRFQPTETRGEYQFNTGVVEGTLRPKGKSRGLAEVTYLPQKIRIDGSVGLFGFYRVFSENTRYGTALWDRDSISKLLPDGAVQVYWPTKKEYPFEVIATYRWADASTLDLETRVKSSEDLPKFEVFLASYFHKDFPASYIYVRKESLQNTPWAEFVEAQEAGGTWQMYPRDKRVLALITDGRWQKNPHPLNWNIREFLAAPVGIRRHKTSGLNVVLMARPQDCFAIATPCPHESHHSQYLSLFGRDVKKGKPVYVRTRLWFTGESSEAEIMKKYRKFIQETQGTNISNRCFADQSIQTFQESYAITRKPCGELHSCSARHPSLIYSSVLSCFDDFIKSFGIVDGHLGEHLAIETHLGQLQSVDELSVANSATAAGGAETNNPKAAHISFFTSAIFGRVGLGLDPGLLRQAPVLAARTAIPSHFLEKTFLGLAPGGAFTYSRHGSFPFLSSAVTCLESAFS